MRHRTAIPCALAMQATAALGASGIPSDPDCHALRALTRAYLDCERAALRGPPPAAGEVMRCSLLYEDLKARRFGGDAAALRDWSNRVRHLWDRGRDPAAPVIYRDACGD